jgi:hypothetical protein
MMHGNSAITRAGRDDHLPAAQMHDLKFEMLSDANSEHRTSYLLDLLLGTASAASSKRTEDQHQADHLWYLLRYTTTSTLFSK